MPNLMLTNRCNFHCKYCFAMDFNHEESQPLDITEGTFLAIVDWLNKKAFPGRILHLMGGEPTLHSDFVMFANKACKEGFDVAVFSNAATPNAPSYAEQLLEKPIRWIINVNPPSTRSKADNLNLQQSLSILKQKATLTFNITPDDPPCEWVIDLIVKHHLAKRIKVGLVLPTLSHQNQHLSRKEYPKFTEKLVEFAQMCDLFDISLEYECGIERCSFTPLQFGILWKTKSTFHSCCDSILDITPDGRVIYCLPLANLRQAHFSEFENYPEAKNWFESQFNMFRPLGSTSDCHQCHLLKMGICRGGCLARVLGGANNIFAHSKRKNHAI